MVLDKPFDKVYELGFDDFLHIHAIGGNGGRGGDGGRGHTGRMGINGMNAT
jgi:hypothetical protein